MARKNEFDQPIGNDLPADWQAPPRPPRNAISGARVRLEPVDVDKHADDLFAVNRLDQSGAGWTYLNYGPFDQLDDYVAWLKKRLSR